MKKSNIIYSLIVSSGILLLFQNCQPSFLLHTVRVASKTETKATDQMASPFSFSKVILNEQNLLESEDFKSLNTNNNGQVSIAGNDYMLPAGFELSVIVDNECGFTALTENGNTQFSTQMINKTSDAVLKVQNYNYKLSKNTSLQELEAELQNDPCVIGASEESTFSINLNNDPRYQEQIYLRSIKAPESHALFWNSSLKITNDVVVAIVDTGVDIDHEDLKDQLWTNAQGEHGYDFVNNDANPNDDQGHGTHVAGLTAMQSNNQIGGSGVIGFKVKIMGIKVLSARGSGSTTAIANGIRFAADNGAKIINMSLGGPGPSASMQQASQYAINKGATVLVAAGNDNRQLTSGNFYSPAGYGMTLKGMITVGSISENTNRRSGFSNYSTSFVEISAPGSGNGGGILSTYNNGGYRRIQGTSMATPVAAGAAALAEAILSSNNITHTPEDIEDALQQSSVKDRGLASVFKDGNRIDLERLSNYLQDSHIFDSTAGIREEF